MVDRVGQQPGQYRLLRLLGTGGFAAVYLGEHVRLGTQAAIKVLSTHLADEDEAIFQQEARTIAALEHPHIVRVLDMGNISPPATKEWAVIPCWSTRRPSTRVLGEEVNWQDNLEYVGKRRIWQIRSTWNC